MDFNITICNIDDDLSELINEHLIEYKNISYYNEDFRNLPDSFDCIVSPGNSFGLMDGGVDGIIRQYFKDINIVTTVQTELLNKVGGFHQPGACMLVNTTNEGNNCKYLAHCPTMVVPRRITDYTVVYWCIWNLLTSVHEHNIRSDIKIKNIICPCLGTGVGNVKYEYFIKLFKLALDNFDEYLTLKPDENGSYCLLSWSHATKMNERLYTLVNRFEAKKDTFYDLINKRRENYKA